MPERSATDSGVWKGRAPAKVNLRLRVLERESDGYHRLETVFQALELADTLEIALTDQPGIVLEVRGVPDGEIGRPEENLAVRAAVRLVRAVEAGGGRPPGISIRLEKAIPHGAGLGGGSSDAAAVLHGVNALLGAPISREELVRMAKELGADVPFFVSETSRAIGLGRGDEISPLPPLPRRPLLLVVPAPGIVTGWAYGVLAAHRILTGERIAPRSEPDRASAEDWAGVARVAGNDFEAALFPHRPELEQLKEVLLEGGARPALLSGSGSALFGVFEEEGAATRAAERVGAAFPGARLILTHTAM
ncbi:MAG: 4-(cytidine 5'-diphospho)-2-C-methyl-D-erythritol kinase [Gemmatimonadota bacterium]